MEEIEGHAVPPALAYVAAPFLNEWVPMFSSMSPSSSSLVLSRFTSELKHALKHRAQSSWLPWNKGTPVDGPPTHAEMQIK
eukprot:scaffold53_cov381-Pavlova_lutheri.AAC.9